MYSRRLAPGLVCLLAACVLGCAAAGQRSPDGGAIPATTGGDSASGLQDLVGVRGASAESQMEARGYASVGGGVEGDAKVTYWRSGDGRCVAVTTADGRYAAIAPATGGDCDRAGKAAAAVPAGSAGYRTVCGVMVDGKPVRYVCSVVGGDQRSTPTTLRFPDMSMTLDWLGGNRVRIEMEGTVPIEGTWSESEGETDVVTPEKTWFYISDREAADREVRSMD